VRRGEVHQQGQDQGFARLPAAVDGGFADAGASSNVFKAQVGIAVLDEQVLGGLLRYFNDLSVADTAEVLGCAEGTVKALTNQAVANLRRRLGTEIPDEQENNDA
jgi:hypothetical protein